MSNKSAASTSAPIVGLLGVLFVGLKLTGFINWSWWWVTAPFWGPVALVAAIFCVGLPIILILGRR